MKDIKVIDGITTTQEFASVIDANFKELQALTGSSSSGVIEVTYSELVSLINTSALTEFSYYKITDFQTAHYMYDGYDVIESEINYGIIEPLFVKSITTNTISEVAFSELYPQDLIYYDWNPDNWKNDLCIGAYNYEVLNGFKGVIFNRKYIPNNVSVGFDFRNVKFRRYATTDAKIISTVGTKFVNIYQTIHDNGGAYNDYTIFNCPDGDEQFNIQTNNVTIKPIIDDIDLWNNIGSYLNNIVFHYFPLDNSYNYYGVFNSVISPLVGNITVNGEFTTNVMDGWMDNSIFADACIENIFDGGTNYRNNITYNIFKQNQITNTIIDCKFYNVFSNIFTDGYLYSVTTYSYCQYNNFSGQINNCIFGTSGNTSINFTNNKLKDIYYFYITGNCTYNDVNYSNSVTGGTLTYSTIKNNFNSNSFTSITYSNIDVSCTNNTFSTISNSEIGKACTNNHFTGGTISYCNINNNFTTNTLNDANFYNLTIGDEFINNTITSSSIDTVTIGSGFKNNTITAGSVINIVSIGNNYQNNTFDGINIVESSFNNFFINNQISGLQISGCTFKNYVKSNVFSSSTIINCYFDEYFTGNTLNSIFTFNNCIFGKNNYSNNINNGNYIGISVGDYFSNNTFTNFTFLNNIIGDYFTGNTIISNAIQTTTIKNYCCSNNISDNGISNTSIGDYFTGNTVNNSGIQYSTIGNKFVGNTITQSGTYYVIYGDNCSGNTIASMSNANIGNYFKGNNVGGSGIYNSNIGDYFTGNTITISGIYYATIGNYCYSNTIGGSGIHDTTIGSWFTNNTVSGSGIAATHMGDFIVSNYISGSGITNSYIGNNYRNNSTSNVYISSIGDYFTGNTISGNLINSTIGDYFMGNTFSGSGIYTSYIGDYFTNNVIGGILQDCTIGNAFQNNTVSSNIQYSTIGYNCKNNTITDNGIIYCNIMNRFNNNIINYNGMSNNIISDDFTYNNINGVFSGNTIGDGFTYITLSGSTISGGTFVNNIVESGIYGTSSVRIDISNGVVVANSAIKPTVYKRPDGTIKLRYYNDSDALVIGTLLS